MGNRAKKELDGVYLNEEQQSVYDVFTDKNTKAVIRIQDLDSLKEYVILRGSRGKGARKILVVHYAGTRGVVTAKEIVNIGEVIRYGKYREGDTLHPTSHSYEMNADDGARLRVVIDFDKQKNKSVINFYSNRKTENRAHQASSGTTDSENTLSQPSANIKPFSEKNSINLSVPVPEGDLFTWANENPQEDNCSWKESKTQPEGFCVYSPSFFSPG